MGLEYNNGLHGPSHGRGMEWGAPVPVHRCRVASAKNQLLDDDGVVALGSKMDREAAVAVRHGNPGTTAKEEEGHVREPSGA